MIKVTRFNGKIFYVNCDLIEFLESTPDTVITTTTGKKIVVSESVEEVIHRIIQFKGKIYCYKEQEFEKAQSPESAAES
ncbi:MAG: flagellar FlbD family protein [Firmicutes bacterium]|nr:flagellar FlbD family protein [Bacillota bacterium]